MPRVFVSYSRKDSLEFARRLQALLEAEGFSLYRHLTDLEGGEDWWRQVEAAIRSVEHVVLVLSEAGLRSPYVARKCKLARQEGRKVSTVSGPASWSSRSLRASEGGKPFEIAGRLALLSIQRPAYPFG